MTVIYTSLDLLADLYDIVSKSNQYMIVYNYDELVLKIYYKRHRQVALRTIMNKLELLAKENYIQIKQVKQCKWGVCTSEKARIYIRKSIIMNALQVSKTITLMNYMV